MKSTINFPFCVSFDYEFINGGKQTAVQQRGIILTCANVGPELVSFLFNLQVEP